MARARNIKPSFFHNEELVELPFEARLLFIGLWTLADREGRLEDRPKKIKMELFPADNINIDELLQCLHGAGFVQRYVVDNTKYIQVLNFVKHQQPHIKETPSRIPAPDMHGANTVQAPDMHGANQSDCLYSDSLIPSSLNPSTTTALRTREEKFESEFRESFRENESRLKELFPHADFEAEKETCIAYYRNQPPPVDPYATIMKWFNRITKPKPQGPIKPPPKTFGQIETENNLEVLRKFGERIGHADTTDIPAGDCKASGSVSRDSGRNKTSDVLRGVIPAERFSV